MFNRKKINEAQVTEFKHQARRTLKTFVQKVKTKSPIHRTLARNMACINPTVMVKEPSKCKSMFKKVLKCCLDADMLQNEECDKITAQFSTFILDISKNATFKEFKICEHRLDELFSNSLKGKKEYKELWAVISKMLLISHGQATVERGFSVNKQAVEVNQSEESLIGGDVRM